MLIITVSIGQENNDVNLYANANLRQEFALSSLCRTVFSRN